MQYSNGDEGVASDAIIVLRMKRTISNEVFHIRLSVSSTLSKEVLLGRSAILQIGRFDLLDPVDQVKAEERAKSLRKSTSDDSNPSEKSVRNRL